VSSAPDGVSGKGRRRCLEGPNAVAVKNELLGEHEVRESLTGNVRLVIGAAEVGDLGVDTPEGDQRGLGAVRATGIPAEMIAHCVWRYTASR
jgi:hypothetical protein